jgi:hypothetical protein
LVRSIYRSLKDGEGAFRQDSRSWSMADSFDGGVQALCFGPKH